MKLLKQKQVPILGALNQVIGGAIGWFGTMTFINASIAAWNTPTLDGVREALPWLNLYGFIAIMLFLVVFACWLQHTYVQPSSVNYWRKMFYDNNPAERRTRAMAEIMLRYIVTPSDRDEARQLLEEAEQDR